MALTLPRWIAALLIGSLIAAVILLTPRTRPPRQRETAGWAMWEKYRKADGIASRSAVRLRTSQVADSVMAALSKLPRADASRTVFGKGLEPSLPFLRTAVDRLAANRLQTAVAPIDLVIVLNKTVTIQGHEVGSGWNDRTVVLPRTTADRCVSIVRLGNPFGGQIMTEEYAWLRNRTNVRLLSAETLGPCGFYEAFGAPGPQIDEWLRAGAWRLGMAGTVSTLAASEHAARLDSALSSPWLAWAEADFRHNFTTTGYRCMTGDAASCASIVLSPKADANLPLDARVLENGVLERGANRSAYWVAGNLGGAQEDFFADMIRTLGRERFQRFWTSDKAPAVAFEAAFGQDIGSWTVEWSRVWYGARGRGPDVSTSSAIVSALVVLLSIGGVIAAARRRQVA